MCNLACIDFGRKVLREKEIMGKAVIDVGARNINGSLRPIVEAFKPASYLGVDIQTGPGVDLICDAEDLLIQFGTESFDLLISTELLEHVKDWRKVITNFKQILKPNGVLVVTTRSKGFPCHDYPHDYWRYKLQDMQYIFSDFKIEYLENDPVEPGVFVKAKKPAGFKENDLSSYTLYSVRSGQIVVDT